MPDIDPRNGPAGYTTGEPPQRYLIRCITSGPIGVRAALRGTTDPAYTLGALVEHQTEPAFDYTTQRWHHALASDDQLYADLCVRLVQRSCEYFYEKDWVQMVGAPDIVVTDNEVRASIRTLDLGENTREAVRTRSPRFVLTDLPWRQQRALVEQLWALREKWRFRRLGPARALPEAPEAIPEGEPEPEYAWMDD